MLGDYLSEAMTVERMIEAYWDLNRYWTKVRLPIKVSKNYTDIDVVAYNPLENILIIAESKVKGNKNAIRSYLPLLDEKGINFVEFDKVKENGKEKQDYLSFIRHYNDDFIKQILQALSLPDDRKITINFHLVSNYVVEASILNKVKEEVKEALNKNLTEYQFDSVILESTFDLFCNILAKDNKDEKDEDTVGKRYGHPVLDIAREINRYMNPKIEFKKYGSINDRSDKEQKIKEELEDKFKKAYRKTK